MIQKIASKLIEFFINGFIYVICLGVLFIVSGSYLGTEYYKMLFSLDVGVLFQFFINLIIFGLTFWLISIIDGFIRPFIQSFVKLLNVKKSKKRR